MAQLIRALVVGLKKLQHLTIYPKDSDRTKVREEGYLGGSHHLMVGEES